MRLIRLCMLLLTPLSALPALAQAPRAMSADRIVAVVNDEAITANELRARLTTVERQLRGQGTQLPPRNVLESQLLERLIMDRIQVQFAKETSTRIEDGQLDAALRRIAENNRLSLTEFRAALEKDGISWTKFRDEIREEMLIARLREREVDNKITVSEGEIDNYLANPQVAGGNSDDMHLAHILLRLPEQASPDQMLRIRARAEQALLQVKRGDDFAKVAASFSDAPDALQGGSLGLRPLDRLPALYAEAGQKLKPGESSDILRSAAGFHIVKLIERRGGVKAVVPVRQTHARHILIKVNEVVSEAEAKRKLLGLAERIANGADFAELARLNSNDLTAAKGGDLGWLYPGDTVPDFEKAMDALPIKGVSEPVQSPFGWHLIQVLERRVEDASPDRQRQTARLALRERKSDEAYQDWLRQMRDRAYVEMRREDK